MADKPGSNSHLSAPRAHPARIIRVEGPRDLKPRATIARAQLRARKSRHGSTTLCVADDRALLSIVQSRYQLSQKSPEFFS